MNSKRRDTESSFLDYSMDDFRQDITELGTGVDRRHSVYTIGETPNVAPQANIGGVAHLEEIAELKSTRINLVLWWIGFFASLIAACLFFVGSFFFIPAFSANIADGCFMFVTGVCLFWACSLWSAFNFRSRHVNATTSTDFICKKVLISALEVDFAAEVVWVLCYCNYLPGSALFLPWLPPWCVQVGAWQFIFGSIFCMSASFMQMVVFLYMNIKGQEPFLNMTLDISSSCSYIVGAVLWACASVLYVIDVPEDNVYVTAALTYVVGSGFFISGAANSLAVLHLRLKAVRRRLDEIRNFNVSQSALNADPHDY